MQASDAHFYTRFKKAVLTLLHFVLLVMTTKFLDSNKVLCTDARDIMHQMHEPSTHIKCMNWEITYMKGALWITRAVLFSSIIGLLTKLYEIYHNFVYEICQHLYVLTTFLIFAGSLIQMILLGMLFMSHFIEIYIIMYKEYWTETPDVHNHWGDLDWLTTTCLVLCVARLVLDVFTCIK